MLGDFSNPTHLQATSHAGFRHVCWVCWVYAPGRACAQKIFFTLLSGYSRKILHATPPKTQHTQHTQHRLTKTFDFIGFCLCWVCVGLHRFVLGHGFSGGAGQMIEVVEVLLRHWAVQCGQMLGGEGAGASPLAGLIDWKGAPPRGEPGSRLLLGGTSVDHRAREVQACIDAIERRGEEGACLARLARLRYLSCPPRTVKQQIAALEVGEITDRTYRNWVQRLHELVLCELTRRHAGTLEAIKALRKAERRRTAARRGKAVRGVNGEYRSSAIAPPSAPASPRQPVSG